MSVFKLHVANCHCLPWPYTSVWDKYMRLLETNNMLTTSGENMT